MSIVFCARPAKGALERVLVREPDWRHNLAVEQCADLMKEREQIGAHGSSIMAGKQRAGLITRIFETIELGAELGGTCERTKLIPCALLRRWIESVRTLRRGTIYKIPGENCLRVSSRADVAIHT